MSTVALISFQSFKAVATDICKSFPSFIGKLLVIFEGQQLKCISLHRYDIAVLRLNRPVIYRANILPICLPDPNDNFIGDVGIVAGWGKTDNSFGKWWQNPN